MVKETNMVSSCSVITHIEDPSFSGASAAHKQHCVSYKLIKEDDHSPFASHGVFKRWSPFMGCCRRDLSPVIELRCPPVREPAGWVQLPNCGLAPAGRSGVGSWESCLDILDQTGSQKHTWGTWRGVAKLPLYLPIGQVCWMTVREYAEGVGVEGRQRESFEKCPCRIKQPL